MSKVNEHNYNQSLPENKYNPLAWVHPNAVIGENCWIGSGVVITDNVEIGDNVSISCNCCIYDHDNSYHRATEGQKEIVHHKVKIGSNTQIGSGTVIVPKDSDITIGNNVIVGALTLVKKSIPSYSIVAGIPAKVIGDVRVDKAK